MRGVEAKLGRLFLLRLEDGDQVPGCIEQFAREQGIKNALVTLVGGIGAGTLVVGPEGNPVHEPVRPMTHELQGVHEVAAVGLLAPTDRGEPVLHMHAALGREGNTRTGCVRTGVEVWITGEVWIQECTGAEAVRKLDPATGFELLHIETDS